MQRENSTERRCLKPSNACGQHAANTPLPRNAGKTLATFVDQVNAFIRKRRGALAATEALQLPEEHAFLTEAEVVAVRMYSGAQATPRTAASLASQPLSARPSRAG